MSAADDYVAIHEALISKALTAYEERLQALELAANSADSSLVEALRQDRWHATRDAVLGGVSLREYGIDKALHWATEAADRAHGPLVRPLVADAGIAIDPKLFAQGGRFMYTVDAQAHNALLRAASATVGAYSGSRLRHPILQIAIDALAAALKSFER